MIPEPKDREVGDDTDRAQARSEEWLQDALAAFDYEHPGLRNPAPECEWPTHCWACEQAIPEARRKALPGVSTCIDCQQDIEEMEKRR